MNLLTKIVTNVKFIHRADVNTHSSLRYHKGKLCAVTDKTCSTKFVVIPLSAWGNIMIVRMIINTLIIVGICVLIATFITPLIVIFYNNYKKRKYKETQKLPHEEYLEELRTKSNINRGDTYDKWIQNFGNFKH